MILLVRKLLAASANPHAVRAFNQVNALHCAVQTYDVPILLAQDVAINALYKLGNQWFSFPLFEVVHTNDINTLKRLLECEEIIVNLQNANGSTALMRAAKHGFKECCVILLQKGARTQISLSKMGLMHSIGYSINQPIVMAHFIIQQTLIVWSLLKIQDWMKRIELAAIFLTCKITIAEPEKLFQLLSFIEEYLAEKTKKSWAYCMAETCYQKLTKPGKKEEWQQISDFYQQALPGLLEAHWVQQESLLFSRKIC